MKKLVFTLLIFISGCSHFHYDTLSTLQDKTEQSGFYYQEISQSDLRLASFIKHPSTSSNNIHIYIEGDGHSWKNNFTPSSNPTPSNPIALKLALNDPADSIIYLARPCQFVTIKDQPACTTKLWTSHRYSKDVIQVMNHAIDQALSNMNQKRPAKIILFGYSGGGTLAALLSSKRNDVIGLVTIAANLDHKAWTEHHGDSPLFGSENAISIAHKIKTLPQIHLVGDKDTIVPTEIPASFVRQLTSKHAKLHITTGYNHHCCWVENWPTHLKFIATELVKLN